MAKIYLGQNWRIICDTQEDQSTSTDRKIFVKDCDGNISEFAASLDGDPNRIYYDVATTEMTKAGDWLIWPKTTIAGNVAPGEPATVMIYEEGSLD